VRAYMASLTMMFHVPSSFHSFHCISGAQQQTDSHSFPRSIHHCRSNRALPMPLLSSSLLASHTSHTVYTHVSVIDSAAAPIIPSKSHQPLSLLSLSLSTYARTQLVLVMSRARARFLSTFVLVISATTLPPSPVYIHPRRSRQHHIWYLGLSPCLSLNFLPPQCGVLFKVDRACVCARAYRPTVLNARCC